MLTSPAIVRQIKKRTKPTSFGLWFCSKVHHMHRRPVPVGITLVIPEVLKINKMRFRDTHFTFHCIMSFCRLLPSHSVIQNLQGTLSYDQNAWSPGPCMSFPNR